MIFDIGWKIPFFMLSRQLGWPKLTPINLTVSPSARCNSRCQTCNIWKKRAEELTLEEWGQVFQSLGRSPFWFTVSGGEPFLYRDIVAFCESIYEHCSPGIINIPTNGLLSRIIPARVEEICQACPDAQIIVNLSLDGVGEKHDFIRGVPGNFEHFERTLRGLRDLGLKNLTIGIHSVISKLNIDDFPELLEYGLSAGADSYITEIAEQRMELDSIGLDITPTPELYAVAVDQLLARLEETEFGGVSRVTEAFRVEYYNLVKRVLVERRQVIPCYAGWASAQIYANGDVWTCCVRAERIGNLREVGYDFHQAWFSPTADQLRKSIKAHTCHCPLANAGYTNMLLHPPTLARVASRIATTSLIPSVRGHRTTTRPPRPQARQASEGPH